MEQGFSLEIKGTNEWSGLVLGCFNNISVISWRPVSLVEETGVPGENYIPVVSQWQTLSHKVASSTPPNEWNSNSQY